MFENLKNKIVTKRILCAFMMTLFVCAVAGSADAAKLPVRPAQVKNVKAAAYGKTSHKITWKKVTNVSGYQIYCRDYSSGSSLYRKVKTVGGSKTSAIVSGRKQGKAYAYVVRAYRKNAVGITYGKLSAVTYGYIKKTAASTGNTAGSAGGAAVSGTTQSAPDKLADDIIVSPSKQQKYKKVFGNANLSMRYPGGYYSSASQASANMTSVTVKTWDYRSGKSGEKYTRTWTIQVHKSLASTVKQIFKEIYEDPEKFPIHELGGYDWRGGHSEHNTGTAIDINWTENYMVNVATGVISAGSFWRPGEDPYSIPKDGVVARIFKKYGFSQGDWGNSKDYMHFSYFGT